MGLAVRDIERSRDFYCRVLGCEVAWEHADEQMKIVFLHNNGTGIELIQRFPVSAEPPVTGVIDHFAFRVPDMDAALANLKENGVTFLFEAPQEVLGGLKIFYFLGPDGEHLEFMQEPPRD